MSDQDWHEKCFYRVGVKALIRDSKGKILVVREKGAWGLPGGGWDYDETGHQALKRELFEEIALTSGFSQRLFFAAPKWLDTKQAWMLLLTYEIKYDKLEFSIGEHGDEIKWIDEVEIDKYVYSGSEMLQALKSQEVSTKPSRSKAPVFVTGNADKAKWFSDHVGGHIEHVKLDLDEIQELDPKRLVEHKLRQAYRQIQRPVIVEDVTFSLEALDYSLPGPFIKFYTEAKDGLEKLCRMCDGFDSRRARVQTTYGYFDGQDVKFFVGEIYGEVAQKPRIDGGFGFDPILIVDGFGGKTASQLKGKHYEDFYKKIKPLDDVKKFLEKVKDDEKNH